MKRLFWLGVGLAVGVVVVRVVTKKAQSYSPRGIAASARDSGRNLLDSARDFVDDVRDGMHEREIELRAGFGDVHADFEEDEDLAYQEDTGR
jgi:hypothetical protein